MIGSTGVCFTIGMVLFSFAVVRTQDYVLLEDPYPNIWEEEDFDQPDDPKRSLISLCENYELILEDTILDCSAIQFRYKETLSDDNHLIKKRAADDLEEGSGNVEISLYKEENSILQANSSAKAEASPQLDGALEKQLEGTDGRPVLLDDNEEKKQPTAEETPVQDKEPAAAVQSAGESQPSEEDAPQPPAEELPKPAGGEPEAQPEESKPSNTDVEPAKEENPEEVPKLADNEPEIQQAEESKPAESQQPAEEKPKEAAGGPAEAPQPEEESKPADSEQPLEASPPADGKPEESKQAEGEENPIADGKESDGQEPNLKSPAAIIPSDISEESDKDQDQPKSDSGLAPLVPESSDPLASSSVSSKESSESTSSKPKEAEPLDSKQSDSVVLKESHVASSSAVEGSDVEKLLAGSPNSARASNAQSSESTEQPNTGESAENVSKASKDATILVVLFVIVLIIGGAAVTHHFIKRRKQKNAETNELSNGVRKDKNIADIEKGTEMKPLIKDNNSPIIVTEYSDSRKQEVAA